MYYIFFRIMNHKLTSQPKTLPVSQPLVTETLKALPILRTLKVIPTPRTMITALLVL